MTPKRTRRTERDAERDVEELAERDVEEGAGGSGAGEEGAADQELNDLGVELPEGAMYTLWRIVQGGEKEFIEEQPVVGFTTAAVAARFGGGSYIMYLKKPHPEIAGRWFKAGSKKFRVVGQARAGLSDAPALAVALPGASEVQKLQQLYGELIATQVKSTLDNAQLLQQMQLAVVASLSQRPVDSSMELLKSILPALIGKPTGKEMTIADVIAVADKMANRNSPTSQMKDTLELMAAARDMAGDGAGSGVPAWIGIAEKAVDVISRATRYNPPQLAPGPAAPVYVDVPPIVAPTPTEGSDVPATAHPLFKWLAPQIPALVGHAQADHDPDSYAGMLVDMIPAEHYASVLAFVESADFLPQLQTTFPMLLPVQSWFGELRQMIIERLRDELAPPAGTVEEPAT